MRTDETISRMIDVVSHPRVELGRYLRVGLGRGVGGTAVTVTVPVAVAVGSRGGRPVVVARAAAGIPTRARAEDGDGCE